MVKACSHTVIASERVPEITEFYTRLWGISAHFANAEFSEFVLPSGFRVAFFRPVGESKKRFDASGTRQAHALGLTVENVHQFYENQLDWIQSSGGSVSGPPKDHPWGEASFLLTDPEGNRWEITQSPSEDGMLINRD